MRLIVFKFFNCLITQSFASKVLTVISSDIEVIFEFVFIFDRKLFIFKGKIKYKIYIILNIYLLNFINELILFKSNINKNYKEYFKLILLIVCLIN